MVGGRRACRRSVLGPLYCLEGAGDCRRARRMTETGRRKKECKDGRKVTRLGPTNTSTDIQFISLLSGTVCVELKPDGELRQDPTGVVVVARFSLKHDVSVNAPVQFADRTGCHHPSLQLMARTISQVACRLSLTVSPSNRSPFSGSLEPPAVRERDVAQARLAKRPTTAAATTVTPTPAP